MTTDQEVGDSSSSGRAERTLALQGFFSLQGGARWVAGVVFLNVFWGDSVVSTALCRFEHAQSPTFATGRPYPALRAVCSARSAHP